MKMNKMAAGALALALGLGAVAPAVAAEKSYSGAQLVLEQYEKELKEVNEMREKAIAQGKINAKVSKDLKDAKARYEAAKKAYEALFPAYIQVINPATGEPIPVGDLVKRSLVESELRLEGLTKIDYNYATEAGLKFVDKDEVKKADRAAAEEALYKKAINAAKEELEAAKKDEAAKKADENSDDQAKKDAYKAAKERLENAEKLVKAVEGRTATEVQIRAAIREYINEFIAYGRSEKSNDKRVIAYQELLAAIAQRDVAQSVYDRDYNEKPITDYEGRLKGLQKIAETYGYVVQIGNNGIKLVKEGDAKIKAPGKNDVATLEEVKAKAEKTLEAAKLIIKNWPETVKSVRKDLDALIEKQEKNIKIAEERIKASKKVSLVSVAFADEDKRSDDELIEDMLSTDKEINDKLDANEKKAKEENEKKPEEKKPEDKKEEEKKPEEKKPAKEAGKNVKTGVAGIAGVAGILAAASVAYAASKRD